MSEQTRINKYLSTHGYCSRREADRLVEQGKVFINDRVANLGDLVSHGDDVRVEGRDRKLRKELIYLLLHKPIGYSTDTKKDRYVLELIDVPERVYPVGRLDARTTGLLLLTNDGTLAGRLINPRYQLEQEYVFDVEQAFQRLHLGEFQQIGKTRLLSPTRFAIILKHGSQHDVIELCRKLGYQVTNVMRTRMGPLKMQTTYPEGNARHLTQKELRDLQKSVGLEPKR